MRRLKKNLYLSLCAGLVASLAAVRAFYPEVMPEKTVAPQSDSIPQPVSQDSLSELTPPEALSRPIEKRLADVPRGAEPKYHPIYSVYSYARSFPDLQDVQIKAAIKWGVKPVKNRQQAEQRKNELTYIGASPYYDIDPQMNRSIPYLVPRASVLLHEIGRNFLDSLYVKGIPLHKVIVSSVLRTEDDVARLRRHNQNAHGESCHRFGTTFDICYNRYTPVARPVQNDTLKWVLSEVLRDEREQGRCYIKHEIKQGCFHITVR